MIRKTRVLSDMTFDLGDVLGRGVDRLTSAAGAIMIVALGIVGVAQTIVIQDLIRAFLEGLLSILDDPAFREGLTAEQLSTLDEAESDIESAIADLPLALGLDPAVAALLWLVIFVVGLAVVVVALDTFGNERDTITGLETDRLGWKTLNLFIGSIVFGILFFIGLIFFVIPGLIFAILMFFFPAGIALRNESFFSAFATSAGVVRRNILGTLGLVVVAVIISIILGFVGGLIPSVTGTIIEQFISAIAYAFVLATMAIAYVDDTAEEAATGNDDGTADAI